MRNKLSTLLFVVAAALFAVVLYMYIQDRRETDEPPPPPSVPGHAELKNVHDALTSQNLEVEYGRDSARSDDLSPAGQQLTVDGRPLYVFIYGSTAEREVETETLELDTVELLDSFGDPLPTESVHGSEGSNIVTILDGGDTKLAEAVDAAVASIP